MTLISMQTTNTNSFLDLFVSCFQESISEYSYGARLAEQRMMGVHAEGAWYVAGSVCA